MKPGDLRRFTAVGTVVDDLEFGVGDLFVVLEIVQPRSAFPRQVTFLVNGTIMTGWGYPWIMNSSEAVNEEG